MGNEVDLTIIERINKAIGENNDNEFEDICDASNQFTMDVCSKNDCCKCPLYHNRINLEEIQKKLDVVNLISD